MKKTVYVLYRQEALGTEYAPVFYSGALTAYETYEEAFEACDLEKEVIVKVPIDFKVISKATVNRLKTRQYNRLNNVGERNE